VRPFGDERLGIDIVGWCRGARAPAQGFPVLVRFQDVLQARCAC
jgi:hypothetical protein